MHMTWLVNSAVHIWGEQPYESGDNSRNNYIVGLLVFGDVSAELCFALLCFALLCFGGDACVRFCICLDTSAGPEPNYRAYQMSCVRSTLVKGGFTDPRSSPPVPPPP